MVCGCKWLQTVAGLIATAVAVFQNPGNWQLQFSCDQLWSSLVASLLTGPGLGL